MSKRFLEYQKSVTDVDYRDTFHYFTFHTPFGGMVKGAHRTMMRKMTQAQPEEIETDFEQCVIRGMNYSQRVGNIMDHGWNRISVFIKYYR